MSGRDNDSVSEDKGADDQAYSSDRRKEIEHGVEYHQLHRLLDWPHAGDPDPDVDSAA